MSTFEDMGRLSSYEDTPGRPHTGDMDLSKADEQSGLPGPIANWGSGALDTDTTGTMFNANLSPEQFGMGPLGTYSEPAGMGGVGVYSVGVATGTV